MDAPIECVLTTWGTDRPALQKVRRAVFIVEQRVPESEEWDGDDLVSVHALATLNREPVGTGRLNPAGKIGRIAVVAGMRGRGIGATIVRRLLEEAYHRGLREPYLHAQLQAVPFYRKFGFRSEGEVFDEAGIPHVRMKHALE
ncbi:MAG: GNAT family N-acetyltransferase [Steroidobacteraceae bacterium]|nr:GNAT family N-acetyltransferase [Steroidobacteraceae bacterium]